VILKKNDQEQMTTHSENRVMPYSADQMYRLIADI